MSRIVTLTPNPALDIAAHVAGLVPSHKMRCFAVRRDPGGGGINVARVAHRLGGNAFAIYAAGGSVGDELAVLLDREGLAHRPVRTGGQTRESFNVFDDSSTEQYRFVLPGDSLTKEACDACIAAALAEVSAGDIFVCSGSLPPGAPDMFYAAALRAAKSKGARTVIDSQGAALSAVLAEGVDIVKTSARELGACLNRAPIDAREWRDALGELLCSGRVGAAAITLGEAGAFLITPDDAWRATVPPVHASTTVGAGDSFLGGLLVRLIAGASLDDALRHAAAAGTAALLTSGTGLCDPAEVARLYQDVEIAQV